MINMKTYYLVPWIEVEYGWGDRPEGYKVFTDQQTCITQTKIDSDNGNYDLGYIGPVRPCYYLTCVTNQDISSSFINKLSEFNLNKQTETYL